ncbi:ThiF family adenylyltransferase [Alkalicoccus urumqiensis]|nr:ThiF family adenylyltransferase [Alkalicoccus urumqiensis]
MNRYNRQEQVLGSSAQKRIEEAAVLVAGAGALGSAAAETLVRAGIRKLILIDRDHVELSNLQRQQLYTEADAEAALPKVEAAARRLYDIRSDVEIETTVGELTPSFLKEHRDIDLAVDAFDNREARRLLNDAAQKYGFPWVYGAVSGTIGMAAPILAGGQPCYRCLEQAVPGPEESCDTAGVVSPAVQWTSAIQTAAALRILGGSEDVTPVLQWMDVFTGRTKAMDLKRLAAEDCPACGSRPDYPALQENMPSVRMLCGRRTVQIQPDRRIPFSRVKGKGMDIPWRENEFVLQLYPEGCRMVVFRDGRVLVHEAPDESEALRLYEQYVGLMV